METEYSFYWGLSMYGGYYATIHEYTGTEHNAFGFNTRTVKELNAKLAPYGLKATRDHRYDNI